MGGDCPDEIVSGPLKDGNVATLVKDCTSDAVDAANTKSENSECQIYRSDRSVCSAMVNE